MIRLKIKDILDEKGKTAYWLSKNTTLTNPAVYKLVKGETDGIKFNTLEEIMEALDITDFNEIFDKQPGQ